MPLLVLVTLLSSFTFTFLCWLVLATLIYSFYLPLSLLVGPSDSFMYSFFTFLIFIAVSHLEWRGGKEWTWHQLHPRLSLCKASLGGTFEYIAIGKTNRGSLVQTIYTRRRCCTNLGLGHTSSLSLRHSQWPWHNSPHTRQAKDQLGSKTSSIDHFKVHA